MSSRFSQNQNDFEENRGSSVLQAKPGHIPVLLKEVLEGLNLKDGDIVVDATAGQGGHARELARLVGASGKVIAIEWDKVEAGDLEKSLKSDGISNIAVINASYIDLSSVLETLGIAQVSGVLMDLGISSWQIESAGRGFSFERDEPLDMRYDASEKGETVTASEIVNTWTEAEIEKILREYGEERFDGRIAKAIVEARTIKPILTTFELVEVVKRAVPFFYRRGRIHCATRTFQALRIAVNQEFANIVVGLEQAARCLAVDGRLAIITFHSLEDRIVKNAFRGLAKTGKFSLVNKKVIRPEFSEITENRRSRSAKLRIIKKINENKTF